MTEVTPLGTAWLDKKALAQRWACSVSWIEKRQQEGMPHARFGRAVRFNPPECERWLEEAGWLQRIGGEAA